MRVTPRRVAAAPTKLYPRCEISFAALLYVVERKKSKKPRARVPIFFDPKGRQHFGIRCGVRSQDPFTFLVLELWCYIVPVSQSRPTFFRDRLYTLDFYAFKLNFLFLSLIFYRHALVFHHLPIRTSRQVKSTKVERARKKTKKKKKKAP